MTREAELTTGLVPKHWHSSTPVEPRLDLEIELAEIPYAIEWISVRTMLA